MTRAEVAAELSARLLPLLTAAGMTAATTTGNLKEPIDDALRMLGYAEAELATAEPVDAFGFIQVAVYATLRAIHRKVSENVNISGEGGSISLGQLPANLKDLVEAARKEAIEAVGWLGGGGMVVEYDLDFLTRPAYSEFEG